jgi:NADPH:quinone reductase
MSVTPASALQLRSLVTERGTVEVRLEMIDVPAPRHDEVLVRVEAAPINPSDLGLLFAAADLSTVEVSGTTERPIVTAALTPAAARAMSARVGQSLPVGNEGAGIVVAAGASPEAQALLGRTVGVLGGAMYSEYRCVHVTQCLALPEGITPGQGASCFVNPLTALGMVGTMQREGHTALVHTAAASNLGQMLNRLCLADGIALVNIVRRPDQAALLRSIGAVHICDSSSPTFMTDLTQALTETGATLAFDAIGGGKLAGQILTCMEAAATASTAEYSRYGSSTHKQVFIYGNLDTGPTTITRSFGFAWGIGGWLLTPFLMSIGTEGLERLRERVAAEITTTFASSYTHQVSLAEMLRPEAIAVYGKQATGEKYLVTPHAGRAPS